jgi:hypothetical protein
VAVLTLAPFAIAVVLVLFAAVRLASLWWKYRGSRVITCPETGKAAGVLVNATRAALTGMAKAPALRLSQCTRWPERAGCGQQCLRQIETAPEDCLVRNILLKWYEGKACASCGRPFGDIPLAGSKPALLLADQVTVEWNQIPADRLPETLGAAEPICFACHLASTLVRERPELVVERPGRDATA